MTRRRVSAARRALALGSPCAHCGKATTPGSGTGEMENGTWDWYMVRDDVWAEAGGPDFLHLACLEARLGRSVLPSELKRLPVNLPGPLDAPNVRRLKARALLQSVAE